MPSNLDDSLNRTPTSKIELFRGVPPIPRELHQFNREKLVAKLKISSPNSVILLQGGDLINHGNTDTVHQFRQESFFMWAFGVREPGYYGLINIMNGESIIFIPRLPEEYATWMGPIPTPNGVRDKYGVTDCAYVDEIDQVLFKINPKVILLLNGLNTDSGLMLPPAQFPNKHKFEVDKTILYHVMSECRVIKSPYEIEMIRQACALSCIAHRYVMLRIHECRFEYQAESLFMHACYFLGGSRTTAYTNNCSSGSNCSILHYGDAGAPNDKRIYSGEICLFDMGASVSGYASDITISFPASAKFTPSQKIIYNAVLSARDAVLEALKPGVSWVDMHKLANRAMFKALVDADILRGDVEDMLRDGLAGIFQPHGLGHLLGIDVHDVGGYLDNNPPRPEQSWLKNLRTARVLEENCVLTVEPGCYFIEPLLAKAFNDKVLSKYFNDEKIQAYRGMGGVRIEDVVAITETGCQVLSSDLPRTVDEIERWMDLSTGADLISVQDVIVETVRKRKLEQIPAGTKILFDLKN